MKFMILVEIVDLEWSVISYDFENFETFTLMRNKNDKYKIKRSTPLNWNRNVSKRKSLN